MGIPKMKIGIDISQIVYGTGVSNYTRNLVTALLKMDKKNDYVLFGGSLRRLKDLKDFHAGLNGDSTLKTFPVSPMIVDFLWNRLHMFPIENFVGNVDVFHSSDWTQPSAKKAKLVTTIHDLVPLLYPESSHPRIVAAHKRRLAWVKKEADGIIAVSEATKKDIVKYLGIPEKKIFVVYEAGDMQLKNLGNKRAEETLKEYSIPNDYVLVVGGDPRKNIERIASAGQRIDLPVVVVGRRWENLKIKPHTVIWVGYAPDIDFVNLLKGARALVYASLYEGFGLPILNAFAVGCPVVTSNISSMPEVAGDAAVLVNPEDVDDIKRGIETALKEREELIGKGYARVKHFSWEKAAEATLQVYKEISQ